MNFLGINAYHSDSAGCFAGLAQKIRRLIAVAPLAIFFILPSAAIGIFGRVTRVLLWPPARDSSNIALPYAAKAMMVRGGF